MYDIFISRQIELSTTFSLFLLIRFLSLIQLDVFWKQYIASTLSLERFSLMICKESYRIVYIDFTNFFTEFDPVVPLCNSANSVKKRKKVKVNQSKFSSVMRFSLKYQARNQVMVEIGSSTPQLSVVTSWLLSIKISHLCKFAVPQYGYIQVSQVLLKLLVTIVVKQSILHV